MSIAANLSKRLSDVSTKILSSIPGSAKSIRDKLSISGANNLKNKLFESESKPNFIKNRQRASNANNLSNPERDYKDPFDNMWLIYFLIVITLIFIAYGIYTFYIQDTKIQFGKTFYGDDILSYEPIFTINTDKIDKCIDRCNKDTLCSGITFNSNNLTCQGTKEGKLRDDTSDYQVWQKPKTTLNNPVKMSTLLGLSKEYKVIKSSEIPQPIMPSRFNYGFYLYINDFYENQGKWRHILHKGTVLEPGQTLNYVYWEDLVKTVPEQTLGVWLAPFNNNLRIAVSTIRPSDTGHIVSMRALHPHAQLRDPVTQRIYLSGNKSAPLMDPATVVSSNASGSKLGPAATRFIEEIEYIDIPNLPTKKIIHISCNFIDNMLEIYLDGRLNKSKPLNGQPIKSDADLQILYPLSISGSIVDLLYYPDSANLSLIQEQMSKRLDIEKSFS